RRRVRNEEQVIAVLKPLGFTPVTLESLSLAEQVALLAAAKFVIAPHGAGLTNLMFCAEGTTVIELFSPRYLSRCYWILCDRLKLKYYYLVGKPLAPNGMPVARHSDLKLPPYPIFEDMAIDLEALKSLVQSLGI
ncbi:MAG: glycosyltransferase family 61 protein, partial [Chroococcales cyanobacterium]